MKIKPRMKKIVAMIVIVLTLVVSPLTIIHGDTKQPNNLPIPGTKGSITVHKFEASVDPVTPSNGQEIGDPSTLGKPLAGVGFTLYKVPDSYDFSANITSEQVIKDNLKPANKVGDETFTGDGSSPSKPLGEAVFDNLDIGYYILEESTPPTGHNYKTMKPAVVAVPYGAGNNQDWNYDVHVYPKNVINEEITKEVATIDPEYTIGDTVIWKIDAKVNDTLKSPDGSTYGKLKVRDALDKRLTYTSSSLVGAIGSNKYETLVAGQDYTFTKDDVSNTIVWEFNEAQVKQLFEKGIQSISVTLTTKINEKAAIVNENEIKNTAIKEWQNHDQTDYSNTESSKNPPKIYLGGVVIKKIDNTDPNNILLLDGAEFKIASSLADAKNKVYIKEGYSTDAKAKDLVVVTGDNPKTSEVEHGYGMFAGLDLGSKNTDTEFFLVETKTPAAPAGANYEYVLRPDVIKVTIPAGKKVATVEIVNTRTGQDGPGPIFTLPNTGGMGTVLFVVVGLGLMIGSSVVLLKTRKRNTVK